MKGEKKGKKAYQEGLQQKLGQVKQRKTLVETEEECQQTHGSQSSSTRLEAEDK